MWKKKMGNYCFFPFCDSVFGVKLIETNDHWNKILIEIEREDWNEWADERMNERKTADHLKLKESRPI